jgi:hypothetical protein
VFDLIGINDGDIMITLESALALFTPAQDEFIDRCSVYGDLARRLVQEHEDIDMDPVRLARVLVLASSAGSRSHNMLQDLTPAEAWEALKEGATTMKWLMRVVSPIMWRVHAGASHESPLARDGAFVMPLPHHRAIVFDGALGHGLRIVDEMLIEEPYDADADLIAGLHLLNARRKACEGITVASEPSVAERNEADRWAMRYNLSIAYLHFRCAPYGLVLPDLFPTVLTK